MEHNKCKICEKDILSENLLCGEEMEEKQLCYRCWFWDTILKEDRISDDYAVVNGKHYVIGSEDDKFKGFDGQTFTIKFNDGRIVTTTNLWCQGSIPEEWRSKFPDNAEFIK